MAVPELGKDGYEPCTSLCASGCGIHARRPASCRTFECQWLRGVLEVDGTLDTDLRPDVCGVIFDYRPHTALGEAYTAWEVEPGAATRAPAREIIRGLQEQFLVVTMTCGPNGEAVRTGLPPGPLGSGRRHW
jgi:Fe-S-cluster containining protein